MFGKKISKGANAVVTGAGSGIGRAFALEIVRRGGRVVCADINLERAQETVDLIMGMVAGKMKNPDLVFVPQAWAVKCDVSKLKDVEALADKAERVFTGTEGGTDGDTAIDLVVNNAGVGAGGKPVGETTIDDWKWTIGVNLWGVIHGCHVFAPRLRKKGATSKCGIINVASTASFAAAPLMGAYNVTKAGALALSETLAAEMAGTGVNVTALCPTFVKTNITKDGRIDAASNKLANQLMEWTGVSADGVVKETLNALDKGQLYVLPQLDARMIWRMKRLMPRSYTRGAGLLARVAAKAF
ncbi:MAG: SDR family NAD(P)-dependent oxidoreductase [Gammaproteobacteria bacterium]|nr:SDR family NAD(P)-dependent oxidoreductase [Gammaproteobacteria bacterium]MBU1528837.1 SDR family NAD(P)-dependent oxidoreductase [Gammaproteobacteria bacterium]